MTALSVMADTAAWHGAWFGPWFLLIPLAWILVFVLIFTFARRFWWRRRWAEFQGYRGESRGYGEGAPGAEAVLRERYARGEIDEAEYRQRLEVLRAEQWS